MRLQRFETLFLFMTVIVIWGIGWPITKIGLLYISPLWLTVMRQLIATVAIFTYLIVTKQLVVPSQQDLPVLFSGGILFAIGFVFLINFGLLYVHAGRAAILSYTTSLWIIPIARIFLHEKPSALKLLGFAFGMAGVIILFGPHEFNWHDTNVLLGNGLLLLAALCWAIVILHTRHHDWKNSPMQIVPWQTLLASIVLGVVVYKIQPSPQIHWNFTLIFVLLFLGIGASGFAFVASLIVSNRLPPLTTSIGFLTVPIISIISSAIILHEQITLMTTIAMASILIGLVFVAIADQKTKNKINEAEPV